jgi:transcriptional regulator with XRE-family HTH domain
MIPLMTNSPSWGSRLRAQRQKAGLSQDALAELCECHQTAISLIESDTNRPGDLLKVRLARALDVDPAELFPLADLSDFVEVGE